MKALNYVSLIVLLVTSCKQNIEGIELTILNNEIFAYCPKGDCEAYHEIYYAENYQEKSLNKMTFKIKNNDGVAYILYPLSFDYGYHERFGCLNLENLMITDSNGINAKYAFILTDETIQLSHEYYLFCNNLIDDYYEGIGYGVKSEKWKSNNSEYIKKCIKIHPGETLYFETYFNLPFNMNIINSHKSGFFIKGDLEYNVRLQFRNNKFYDNSEEDLTEIQKEELHENNCVFYERDLISVNSVPLKIKE